MSPPRAQPYPARPITIIVPFAAGGATDTLTRFLAEQIRPVLGQPIVIENVAGAAGTIGVGRAVRSAADGYTLSIGTSTTHMLTGGLYNLQFDLLKDLEPIILIGSEPLLIVGKKSLPADDLKGLIAWLKANPDKASVGIAGVGATGHLTGISLQRETGSKFAFVPYRGNGPAMQDLLAEQIDFMIEPASNFKSLLGAGSVKPFAITGKARLKTWPNIPTTDEAGLPGFVVNALVRAVGAEGDAEGHHREAQRHHGAGAGEPAGHSSASRNSVSRFRRRTGNRRKRCACSRSRKPSAGGRSSRRRISRWSRHRHSGAMRSIEPGMRDSPMRNCASVVWCLRTIPE